MNLHQLDMWFRNLLPIADFVGRDDSLNGIQVGRTEGGITRVAFAVDACAETVARAAAWGAQMLFVHHGFFWGKSERITGPLLGRVRALLDADMALYACHLPLDSHPVVGNNAVLARLLGLQDINPFGVYHGVPIGCSGRLPEPVPLAEILRRILPDGSAARTVIPAGPASIQTVAVVSGGAAFDVFQAIDGGFDLYLTGEPSHSIYHHVVEAGINFVAAGHYATEVWGVREVAQMLAAATGITTTFIDVPTGL